MDERAALKSRIDMLQMVYGVLFISSLIVLGGNWMVWGHTTLTSAAWALTLGGAVITRLYRTSLVNRYNAADGGPLT